MATLKLDYSLETPEERKALVEQILQGSDSEDADRNGEPNLSPAYLEILADYLVLCMEKQEKKERRLLTENRMATINKRETSFEGLCASFEDGEDSVYNLITNDKNVIFRPKTKITKKDLEEIPELRAILDAIKYWEEKLKTATGRDAYIIKSTIIELRKDQYLIKAAFRKPVTSNNFVPSVSTIPLNEKIEIDKDSGYVIPAGVTLMDPKVISAVLCNYSALKEQCWGCFNNDLWYFLKDFDECANRALKEYPIYDRLVTLKVDGKQNQEIQEILEAEFNIHHTTEYISTLWRNKIPGLIASQAEDDYLDWYYREVEKGQYKRCSRCGQIKLAHNKYFSKNKTSRDGFYSICKKCRNKKTRKSGQI